MAATLVPKSSRAPRASLVAPASRVSPTTASGGTSEMAMATPGQGVGDVGAGEGDGPDRAGGERGDEVDRAGVDAAGHLRAGGRVDRHGGEVAEQPRQEHHGRGAGDDHRRPSAGGSAGRRARWPARCRGSGVISGATIIAPITVAVESLMTPAVAMTAGQHEQHPERACTSAWRAALRRRAGPACGRRRRPSPRPSAELRAHRRVSSHGRAPVERSASHPRPPPIGDRGRTRPWVCTGCDPWPCPAAGAGATVGWHRGGALMARRVRARGRSPWT